MKINSRYSIQNELVMLYKDEKDIKTNLNDFLLFINGKFVQCI